MAVLTPNHVETAPRFAVKLCFIGQRVASVVLLLKPH